jgi:hypothetical protein
MASLIEIAARRPRKASLFGSPTPWVCRGRKSWGSGSGSEGSLREGGSIQGFAMRANLARLASPSMRVTNDIRSMYELIRRYVTG